MAIIQQYRLYNGVNTRIDTNTETGATYIYRPSRGLGLSDTLLFTSEGKGRDWEVNNPELTTRIFNNQNDTEFTPQEFTDEFQSEGYKTYDNDRASVLNNPNNYSSAEEAKARKEAFVENNLPGVKDPNTGAGTNSDGESQENTEGDPVETLEDGSGNNENPDENPNVVNDDKAPGGSKSLSAAGKTLRFPLNAGPREGIDYISITPKKYEAAPEGGNALIDSGFGPSTGATILLPMQPALGEQRGINWNKDNMDFLAMTLGNAAMGAMDGVGKAFNGDLTGAGKDMSAAAAKALENIKGASNDPDIKNFIKSHFARKITGSNIFARQSGSVVNPNLELLFEGPELRTFNFAWKLSPRSREETNIIRAIIKILKKTSAPKGKQGTIFLKTPDIYELKYMHNNDQHPFMNKFKPCALTAMSVDYTPDGSYMTYGDDAGMTSYGLNLSFTEIMPLYDVDYNNSSADMGF